MSITCHQQFAGFNVLFVCLFVCVQSIVLQCQNCLLRIFDSWKVEMDKHRCSLVGFWDKEQAAVESCSSFGDCCHWFILVSSTNMIIANLGAGWLHPMERKWWVRYFSFAILFYLNRKIHTQMFNTVAAQYSPHTPKVTHLPRCASDLHRNPVAISSYCL